MESVWVPLRHPAWNREFIVQTDACVDGMGAALAQKFKHPVSGEMVERPVRYVSRTPQIRNQSGPRGCRNPSGWLGLGRSGTITCGADPSGPKVTTAT